MTDAGTPSDKVSGEIPRTQPLMTRRQQVAMELLETENNYVNILETIIKVFMLSSVFQHLSKFEHLMENQLIRASSI